MTYRRIAAVTFVAAAVAAIVNVIASSYLRIRQAQANESDDYPHGWDDDGWDDGGEAWEPLPRYRS